MENTRGYSEVEIRRRRRLMVSAAVRYIVLIVVALVMIYPIIWLVGATFKSNNEIFTSISFIPKRIDFTPYIEGWKTRTKYTFTTFFLNTFKFVIPKIVSVSSPVRLWRMDLQDLNFHLKRSASPF